MKKAALLLALPALVAFTTPTIVRWSEPKVYRTPTRNVGQAVIRVKANIAGGWHLYALDQKPGGPKALSFEIERNPWYFLGPASGPAPRRAYDQEFKITTDTYSGSPEFSVPLGWIKGAPAGTSEIRLIVRYQACSDKLCLPPRKESLKVTVTQ